MVDLTEEETAAINSSSAHPMGDPLKLRNWGRPPSKIADKLWVGGLYDAFNFPLLIKLRIGAVINVMGPLVPLGIQTIEPVPVCAVPNGIGYAVFTLLEPFGQTLPQATMAIQAIKFYRETTGVNVFVHSGHGTDRAPTVVWKYLVEGGMAPDAAEQMIKGARDVSIVHRDWWT